jgi:putative flippase GtrA
MPEMTDQQLRRRTIIQMIRFALVGALNTGMDFVVFLALVHLANVHFAIANLISYSLAAVNSFVINRFWTFSDRERTGSAAREAGVFAMVTLLGLAVSSTTILALEPFMGATIAKCVSVLATFASTFWLNKRVTFRA